MMVDNEDQSVAEAMSEEQLRRLEDRMIGERLKDSRENVRIKEFISNPIYSLYKYPYYAMFFSAPAALIFLLIGLKLTWGKPYIDDVIIFSVWIFITPPAVTYFRKRRRVNKIEEYLPNFLRDIAEMSRAGLTLPSAVSTVAKGEYGEMSKEIRKMNDSLSWGVSFEITLENFAKRMNTSLISRSVALITQANRAGGRMSVVLEAAAKDASEIKVLQRERRGNMAVYVVISYMSFFVFIFVILMLSSKFVPTMYAAGEAASGISAGGTAFLGSFDPDRFIRILFHASMIQGFVSGLVAGQMGEGELSAGLKHSLVLTFVAWVAFTFVV